MSQQDLRGQVIDCATGRTGGNEVEEKRDERKKFLIRTQCVFSE